MPTTEICQQADELLQSAERHDLYPALALKLFAYTNHLSDFEFPQITYSAQLNVQQVKWGVVSHALNISNSKLERLVMLQANKTREVHTYTDVELQSSKCV